MTIDTIRQIAAQGPFQPDWESLKGYKVPRWYEDAKFGIFIHWGVYAVPAFGDEWYPRRMYEQGTPAFKHHVETYGPQTEFGDKDFIPRFRGEKFDPEAWARLFVEAEAKFVMPVAEHHDGYCLYDSALTEWKRHGGDAHYVPPVPGRFPWRRVDSETGGARRLRNRNP